MFFPFLFEINKIFQFPSIPANMKFKKLNTRLGGKLIIISLSYKSPQTSRTNTKKKEGDTKNNKNNNNSSSKIKRFVNRT